MVTSLVPIYRYISMVLPTVYLIRLVGIQVDSVFKFLFLFICNPFVLNDVQRSNQLRLTINPQTVLLSTIISNNITFTWMM